MPPDIAGKALQDKNFKKMRIMKNFGILPALILAAGLTLLGVQVKRGLSNVKTPVRTVSVKGLSVREVNADKVIWPWSTRKSATTWAPSIVR